MKVAILSDSLGLPREDVGRDKLFEATYPYLLDQSLRKRLQADAPFIMERGMRRRTIERVLDDWYEQVELKGTDVVVVHVGIVDCAPRVFLRREGDFIASLRWVWLRERILKFVHKHRRGIVEWRQRVYVPLERFQRHVSEVIERASTCRLKSLIFVNIITPPDEVESRSPGFQRNVTLYNETLAQEANRETWIHLIDLNRLVEKHGGSQALTVDGIHLNEEGHKILAHELERHITSLLDEVPAALSISPEHSETELRQSR